MRCTQIESFVCSRFNSQSWLILLPQNSTQDPANMLIMTNMNPPIQCAGEKCSHVSFDVRRKAAIWTEKPTAALRRVCKAPLGGPVVPDVKSTTKPFSGLIGGVFVSSENDTFSGGCAVLSNTQGLMPPTKSQMACACCSYADVAIRRIELEIWRKYLASSG